MPILQVQDEFQSGDNVTATSLNNLVEQASFDSGAVDNATLQIDSLGSGYLKVKDNGILSTHLKSDASNDAQRAVTTNHIRNEAVTYAKMQTVDAFSVIGNNTNLEANPTSIAIDDLRDSISNATPHDSDTNSDGINDSGGDDGLMSAGDKTKLDGIEAGATADQTGAEMKTAIGNATAHTSDTNSDGINDTGGNDGLMSAEDKTKLDGVEAGATADQTGAEMKTAIGNATAHTSDTNSDGVNDTGGTNGLLTANDKTKLDGIEAGAEENVQSDWTATSGNAFIKNKPTIAYTSAIGNATPHDSDTNSDGINDTGGNDGLMSAGDKTKLDGIAANATDNAGTVTSITAGTGLSGSTITSSGTIGLNDGGVDTDQLAAGAVTSAKISSTDTTFNVGTTVGVGALSSNAYNLEVEKTTSASAGIALFTDAAANSLVKVENRTAGASIGGTSSEIRLDAHAGSTNMASANIGVFDSTTVGYAYVKFNNGDQCEFRFDNTGNTSSRGSFLPGVDAAQILGRPTNRWEDAYVVNGVTTGSDINDKQDIADLDEAERRVAVAAKGLVKKFRWIKDAQAKGDAARIHVGIMAQELEDAFTAEGLNAFRYGMLCKDDYEEEINGVVTQKTRYSVRYTELLAFIISAL